MQTLSSGKLSTRSRSTSSSRTFCQNRRTCVSVSSAFLLGPKAADHTAVTAVNGFVRSWKKGDIAKLRQSLAQDCLILEPLWGVPGSQSVLCGVDEVARFRQNQCQPKDFSTFNVIDVASVVGAEEDRVFLYFRETCSRKPLAWDIIERALRTRLLFPLYQSDEAGVLMFKLNKSGKIKEAVCIRKPPEVDELACRVAEDEYSTAGDRVPQYLRLFDSM